MSQSGGDVEVSRRSTSPGSLKRKRASPSHATVQGEVAKSAKLTNGATPLSSTQPPTTRPAADGQPSKHYRSPDSDEMQQSDSGDLLRGVGSASSLNSAASSVFSHNSNAFANNRKASLVNGLTPLTSHTDSSPPKGNSPQIPKSAIDMASSNGATASHVPASNTSHVPPPPPPPQEERPSMLPPPGKAKGYRVVWDPELDNKLSKEERKRAAPRKKEFGTEVRHTFHNLLSLHNIIYVI